MKTKDIVPGNLYALKSPTWTMRSEPLVVLDNTAMYYQRNHRYAPEKEGGLVKSKDMRASGGGYYASETGLLTIVYGYDSAYDPANRTPEAMLEAVAQIDVDAIKSGDMSSIPKGYRLEFMNPARIAMSWSQWLIAKAEWDARESAKDRIAQEKRTADRAVRTELQDVADLLDINLNNLHNDADLLVVLKRLFNAENKWV